MSQYGFRPRPVALAPIIVAALTLVAARPLPAQERAEPDRQTQLQNDTETPEAIVQAAYAAIARPPGEQFDWDRFKSLFLPDARLIPNTEQRQGSFDVLTPDGFIDWIESGTSVGGDDDQGFTESAVHNLVERYGDVAHVFSTYEKRYWGESEVLGRGINSFQLVHHQDRWWIVGIVWDEDYAAGPIPNRYGG